MTVQREFKMCSDLFHSRQFCNRKSIGNNNRDCMYLSLTLLTTVCRVVLTLSKCIFKTHKCQTVILSQLDIYRLNSYSIFICGIENRYLIYSN